MSNKNTIRFNVGGSDDTSTDVWRVWTNNDSVYFFLRSTCHKIHVSLHKSGKWKIDLDGKRFSLNREIKTPEKWGIGPAILFPNIPAERVTTEPVHLTDKRIEILQNASIEKTRVVQFLFKRTNSACPITSLAENRFRRYFDWVDKISLKTKGEFYAVSYVEETNSQSLSYFYKTQRDVKINFKKKLPEVDFMANAIVIETPKDKGRQSYLISIPLGKENFQIDQK